MRVIANKGATCEKWLIRREWSFPRVFTRDELVLFIYCLSNPVKRMETDGANASWPKDAHLKQSVGCWLSLARENPSKAPSLRRYDEPLFSSTLGKNLLKSQGSVKLPLSSRNPLFLCPIGYSHLYPSEIQWRVKRIYISRIENKKRRCDLRSATWS